MTAFDGEYLIDMPNLRSATPLASGKVSRLSAMAASHTSFAGVLSGQAKVARTCTEIPRIATTAAFSGLTLNMMHKSRYKVDKQGKEASKMQTANCRKGLELRFRDLFWILYCSKMYVGIGYCTMLAATISLQVALRDNKYREYR